MAQRTPLVVVAGGLGSGKTTLLRHLLEAADLGRGDLGRAALIVNEFGEIGVDGQILEGRNLRLVELPGGCVCCSLAGEFEDAVEELVATVGPEVILVETTGVAEADALVLDIEDRLPRVRIDAVVVVVDADAWRRFPQPGYAERSQVAAADLVALNKVDLVDAEAVGDQRCRLAEMNPRARVVETRYGRIDPGLLVGPRAGRSGARQTPVADGDVHGGFETFHWVPPGPLRRDAFEAAVGRWPAAVYRAKGFVRFAPGAADGAAAGGGFLFNFVAGRWDLEEDPAARPPALVWIGPRVGALCAEVVGGMEACLARGD